jgi:hypothetical protein
MTNSCGPALNALAVCLALLTFVFISVLDKSRSISIEADCNITAATNETSPDVGPQVHVAQERTFQFPQGMLLVAFVVSLGGFVLVAKRLRVSFFSNSREL